MNNFNGKDMNILDEDMLANVTGGVGENPSYQIKVATKNLEQAIIAERTEEAKQAANTLVSLDAADKGRAVLDKIMNSLYLSTDGLTIPEAFLNPLRFLIMRF